MPRQTKTPSRTRQRAKRAPAKRAAPKRKPAADLRARAEAMLRTGPGFVQRDGQALVHELEVHRVELEMQNEELRGAREATEMALERYTEVFDFAPIGYATIAADGSIRELNHAGARLLGAPRVRLIGRRLAEHLARESTKELKGLLDRASADGGPARAELQVERGDELILVRATAAALRRGGGGTLIAFEDITEARASERALAASEAAQRELNRRKDEFIAMLSHELRNPLSAVRAGIKVMQLVGPHNDPSDNALQIVDRSTAHLTRLVDDLLDMSRIEAGKFVLQRATTEISKLVARVLEDRRGDLEKRAHQVHVDLGSGEIWVHGDAERLVQVLSNVLSNAAKFTPNGGTIRVNVDQAGPCCTMRVRDSGIGIAARELAHVFEPFAQAAQGIERAGGGLGLGLALVKSIVEMHDGTVAIRSAGLGHGTEVTITLPTTQAPRVSEPAVEAPAAGGSRRVLVVEDKADTAEAMRCALALNGHTVTVARDGRTAVRLATELPPDVVLCDLGLPDMDGYAVARELRRHPELANVMLVALTGYARPEDIERTKDAGFDRHLPKPPQLDELFRIVAGSRPSS